MIKGRPASIVHTIPADSIVSVQKGVPMLKHKATGTLTAFPAPDAAGMAWLEQYAAAQAEKAAKKASKVPPPYDDPHNFPSQAVWNLSSALQAMGCLIYGPAPAPVQNDSNILYWWIGVLSTENYLLQPVLQAINSTAWTMQSYLVDSSGVLYTSETSDALPQGTIINAQILNNENGSYTSQFANASTGVVYPKTVLNVEYDFGTDPTVEAVFEVYAPQTDYFPTSLTFEWVAVETNGGVWPTPNWAIYETPYVSTMAISTPAPPNNLHNRRNIVVTNTP